MVNSIVVNDAPDGQDRASDPLAGWIVSKVRDWEEYRNTNFSRYDGKCNPLWRKRLLYSKKASKTN